MTSLDRDDRGHHAAASGNVTALRAWLAITGLVDARWGDREHTIGHVAIASTHAGSLECLRTWIRHGGNPHAIDRDGVSLCDMAVVHRRTDHVESLVMHDANPISDYIFRHWNTKRTLRRMASHWDDRSVPTTPERCRHVATMILHMHEPWTWSHHARHFATTPYGTMIATHLARQVDNPIAMATMLHFTDASS